VGSLRGMVPLGGCGMNAGILGRSPLGIVGTVPQGTAAAIDPGNYCPLCHRKRCCRVWRRLAIAPGNCCPQGTAAAAIALWELLPTVPIGNGATGNGGGWRSPLGISAHRERRRLAIAHRNFCPQGTPPAAIALWELRQSVYIQIAYGAVGFCGRFLICGMLMVLWGFATKYLYTNSL